MRHLSKIGALLVAAALLLGLPQPGSALAAPSAAVVPAAQSAAIGSRVIGTSVLGRPIVAYRLGNPRAAFRAVVLGSMHGHLERAGETVTRALRSLPVPANLDLWVIDTINPDGDALGQRGNAHGVDLNRNWPNLWTPIAPGSRDDTHYSGPAALSEPETRAMLAFLQQVRPQRMVSMHQPLTGVDTTDGGGRDPAFRHALAVGLGLPEKALTCYGVCHGTMTGWATNHSATTAITVEFGVDPGAGYLAGPAARAVLAALTLGVPAPGPPPTPFPRIPAAHATRYVSVLYRQLLSRSVEAGSPWVRALQAGTISEPAVAGAIARSAERRTLLIRGAFRVCLGRNVAPPAFAPFLTGARASWAALLGRLCGSGEAVARARGRLPDWVDAVYRAELGRAATAGERAAWSSVAGRTSTIAAATSIAGSPEARSYWLNGIVGAMLGRRATGAEGHAYGPAVPGAGQITIPIVIASSAEYLRRYG